MLFGGTPGTGGLGDTWVWDGTTWTPGVGEEAAAPSPRHGSVMFSLGDAAILFGGYASANLGDTWRYQDGAWTALSPTRSPTPRAEVCATSLAGRELLVGLTLDLWAFDGAEWSSLGDTRYGARVGCALATSAETSQALLIGGTGSEASRDLVEVAPRIRSLDDLTESTRVDRPVRRRGAVFASNPISGGMLLVGGTRGDNGQPLADTWQLHLLGQTCSDDASCGAGSFCTEGACCEQASCGPCGTCADPSAPGVCRPRPAGPAPGCDGAFACTSNGHCRLGPGGPCGDETACASGACIKSADAGTGICCGVEGCAVQCVDGAQLRNPDGTTSSCAPYGCEGNACTVSCSSIADCSEGAICTAERVCVPQAVAEPSADESSCGCEVVGARSRGALGGLALLGLLLARRRRGSVAR